MMIVDSHCHAGLSWFEPVESLIYQMDANGVDQAVLIQHRGNYDNSYLFQCAERYAGRFAVVVMVDTYQPGALSALEKCAAQGAVGVRLNATERSPGSEPMAIWNKAAELRLVVSVSGSVEEFASDDFARLVAEVSGLALVIEHQAGMEPGVRLPDAAFERAMALADHPNTYIKVGGLGEFSARLPVLGPQLAFDYTPPLIESAFQAFGPRRMMWGSDYPPVSGREGYRNALLGVTDHPALGDQEDRELVMGKTALHVFKLGPR